MFPFGSIVKCLFGDFMIEPINTDIGGRIKQIRGAHTQQEFADLLGVGRTTLIRYENNERVPDAELLIKLHCLYKTQPLWVLTGIGEETSGVKLTPDEAALLDNYRHCSSEGKNAVKTTVSCLAQSRGVKKGRVA